MSKDKLKMSHTTDWYDCARTVSWLRTETPVFYTSFFRQSQLSKQLEFTSKPCRIGLLCILWLNEALLDCLSGPIWLDFCSPDEEEEFHKCISKIRVWGKVKVKGSMQFSKLYVTLLDLFLKFSVLEFLIPAT